MSRVADALKQSRHYDTLGATGGSETGPVSAADDQVELPWKFASTSGGTPESERRVPASPAVAPETLKQLFDPAVSPDELIQLVQRLFVGTAAGRTPVRSVLFTAIDSEDGSAAVCTGAAEALSRQVTGSVCVIDGNLRSPAFSASFNATGARGLSNALLETGRLTTCLTQIRPNLWIMPSGTRSAEAQTLVTSAALATVHRQLRSSHEYVLIVCSMAAGALEASMWSSVIDGAVLVMEAGVTRRDQVQRSADTLRNAGIELLGAVLRNRTYPIPDRIYRRL